MNSLAMLPSTLYYMILAPRNPSPRNSTMIAADASRLFLLHRRRLPLCLAYVTENLFTVFAQHLNIVRLLSLDRRETPLSTPAELPSRASRARIGRNHAPRRSRNRSAPNPETAISSAEIHNIPLKDLETGEIEVVDPEEEELDEKHRE